MRMPLARLAAGLSLLLPSPHASAQIAEHYRPGEEAAWVVELGAKRLGHCSSIYEGEVDLGGLRAHRFRDQAQLDLALVDRGAVPEADRKSTRLNSSHLGT